MLRLSTIYKLSVQRECTNSPYIYCDTPSAKIQGERGVNAYSLAQYVWLCTPFEKLINETVQLTAANNYASNCHKHYSDCTTTHTAAVVTITMLIIIHALQQKYTLKLKRTIINTNCKNCKRKSHYLIALILTN